MTVNKPTVEELGVRVDELPWQTSGRGAGMFQVAIVRPGDDPRDDAVWVLVRLEGGTDVQVYDRREWDAWLDGVRRGEFDDLS